ncbi:hypothetical protein LXL04_027941 [Taraxacum kok-saghyz]
MLRSNRMSSGIETGTKLLIANLFMVFLMTTSSVIYVGAFTEKSQINDTHKNGKLRIISYFQEVLLLRVILREIVYLGNCTNGKPMKIELVGTDMGNDNPHADRYGNQNGAPTRGGVMGRLRGGPRAMRAHGGGSGGGGGGGGGGRGRGGGRDVGKYHFGAMQMD